jgi:predicted SAM-dependent methyltransferase
MTQVQYGCGFTAPQEWTNFDASPTLRFERLPLLGRLYVKNSQRFPANVSYGDIRKGLPVPDNSCDFVYCSHVLEHLALNDFHLALANTFRILKPGGVFRCVVPDFEYSVKLYLDSVSETPSSDFLKETLLGTTKRPKGLGGMMKNLLGNSSHLWMWDYRSLSSELTKAGFSNIRRATFGDSEHEVFTSVEERARWNHCLGVECIKPELP